MACLHPLLALDNGIDPDTGKHHIKILPPFFHTFDLQQYRSYYGKSLMMLPCGHCVYCAQDYARTWQARIMCEAEYYEEKCFITLTYKENPPKEPSKEHLRQFIKNVRNKYGKGIKFFGCGEKGELNGRSHYHIIIFGKDFSRDEEVVPIKKSVSYLYASPRLNDLWPYGFSSVGSLDLESAGYVSKYCDKKKITSLDSGEFIIMSRGLGRRYFEDHRLEIFNSDYLYFGGNKFKIPRYFLKLALGDDFYVRILAESYTDRKRLVAQRFRYNHNRSVGSEENALAIMNNIALKKKDKLEAFRDVV